MFILLNCSRDVCNMAIVLRNGNTKHLPPSVEGGDFRRKSEGVFKENNEDHEVVEGEYGFKVNLVWNGRPKGAPTQVCSNFFAKQ